MAPGQDLSKLHSGMTVVGFEAGPRQRIGRLTARTVTN